MYSKNPFFKTLPVLSLLLCIQSSNAADDSRFIELLTFEIQNRVFAYGSVSARAEERRYHSDANFWAAYYALEVFNQEKYQTIADKYDIDMSPTLKTKIKTCIVNIAVQLLPDIAVKRMRDVTIGYLDQLKELNQLADPKDKEFFNYVVLQEQVQVDALKALLEGRLEEATELLITFIVRSTENIS